MNSEFVFFKGSDTTKLLVYLISRDFLGEAVVNCVKKQNSENIEINKALFIL